MSQRIYAIDSVTLTQQESTPPNLLVQVQARAVSSGWRAPTLALHHYRQPPEDGILAFDLIGTAPDSLSTTLPVLTHTCADTVLPDVDLGNFWGVDQPLVGVRCHAQSNAKLALLQPKLGIPEVTLIPKITMSEDFCPQFSRDIRPLFRPYDIAMMIMVRDLDLGSYEAVSQHGGLILSRLRDGSMPCDGPWPNSDIALFEQWLAQGKAP